MAKGRESAITHAKRRESVTPHGHIPADEGTRDRHHSSHGEGARVRRHSWRRDERASKRMAITQSSLMVTTDCHITLSEGTRARPPSNHTVKPVRRQAGAPPSRWFGCMLVDFAGWLIPAACAHPSSRMPTPSSFPPPPPTAPSCSSFHLFSGRLWLPCSTSPLVSLESRGGRCWNTCLIHPSGGGGGAAHRGMSDDQSSYHTDRPLFSTMSTCPASREELSTAF